jgi:hypothetical protein
MAGPFIQIVLDQKFSKNRRVWAFVDKKGESEVVDANLTKVALKSMIETNYD